MAAGKKAAPAPKEEPTEETPDAPVKRKAHPSITDDRVTYVVLVDRKRNVRCYCTSKESVARALESLTAKERENAHVFQLTAVKLETKVSVVWE